MEPLLRWLEEEEEGCSQEEEGPRAEGRPERTLPSMHSTSEDLQTQHDE